MSVFQGNKIGSEIIKPSVLIVNNGNSGRIEFEIMSNIENSLKKNNILTHSISSVKYYPNNLIRAFKSVRKNDIIIIHSPLLFSLFIALFAKFNKKIIIALIWDKYPIIINARKYKNTLIRNFYDFIENYVLSRVDLKIVPSRDFLDYKTLDDAIFIPIWAASPSIEKFKATSSTSNIKNNKNINVLFAGQVNETRGLEQAYNKLTAIMGNNFILTVASADQLNSQFAELPNVVETGFLSREKLMALASQCDCGLISIHEKFESPAYPSKTFDYLSWNLPLLYFGKELPYFTKVIEETGVGANITQLTTLDNSSIQRMAINIETARSNFYTRTILDHEAFVFQILEQWRKHNVRF